MYSIKVKNISRVEIAVDDAESMGELEARGNTSRSLESSCTWSGGCIRCETLNPIGLEVRHV